MRHPKVWNDKELLDDEPFCTDFAVYALVTGRTAAVQIKQGLDAMAVELEDGVNSPAHKWAQLAFGQPVDVAPDKAMREAFVHFYWKLHRNDEHMVFLSAERKKRGCYTTLPDLSEPTRPTKASKTRPRKKHADTSHRATHKKKVLGRQPRANHSKPGNAATGIGKAGTAATIPPPRRGRGGCDSNVLPLDRPNELLKVDTVVSSQTSSTAPHSSQRPRPAKAPPVLKTHTKLRLPPIPQSSVFSSLGGALDSGHEANSSAVETGHTVDIISVEKRSAPGRHARLPLSLPLVSMEVLDTSVERPSSFFEHSPVLPEEQRQILQQNKSGATNSKEGSETLNDPLNKTIHPPETLPYSYSTSTSAGAPGIQENLHLPPVSQLQGFDTSGLLCLDPEELTDMSLSRGDQNQPLHDLQGFSRSKPALPNYPPIWAQSRQEVCESFDWFRSYQGGVYHVRDFVKGYLLSAFSSSRDLFEHDGRLIVSHGGGKAESIHSSQGKSSTQPAEDQLAQDKSVRALLANYRESRPLVLLIDDKYALFPYDLKARNVTYAVLGLYTITHAWAEYQPANNELGRVVRYKFSFQWCEGQGDPWWASHQDRPMDVCEKQQLLSCNVPMNPTLLPLTGPPVKIKEEKLSDIMPLRPDGIYIACLTCDQKTPKVYKQGWACLNPTCRQFWVTLDHGHLPLQLDYNRDFLRLTPPYSLPPNLSDIRPGRPESSLDSITTTYAFTRGLHCRKCGRLSCRDKWEYWQCMQCKDKAGVLGRLRLPKEFWNEILPDSFLDHFIHGSSGIAKGATRLFTHGNGMGQMQTFILPTGRGQIHHIQSITPQGNSDADRIFEKYQEHMSAGRLKFRRWPMRAHKCRGPLLTNYFSQNSGEPYQYVGGTDNTVPFSKTSSAVTGARNLIQKRISQALGMNHEFNEVLSVAYMERQKMAFHSDSERGLGPVVAGLSLGSPALMHFRVHHKYLREDEIQHKPIALTVVLRHGDVLVMDGAGVQENYEHTVVPTNFRIAATARTIDAKAPKIEDIRMGDSTQAVRSGIKSELG